MHDFGRIARQGASAGAVFLFNQKKHHRKFAHCFLGCRHQRMTSRDCGYLRHPPVGLIPIDNQLVVVEAHNGIVLLAESGRHPPAWQFHKASSVNRRPTRCHQRIPPLAGLALGVVSKWLWSSRLVFGLLLAFSSIFMNTALLCVSHQHRRYWRVLPFATK